VTQSAEHSCAPQIDAALHDVPLAQDAQRPPATPQELAQDTRFARCMRQHGWPNFPDPNAQGQFISSTQSEQPASRNDPSWQACRSLLGTRSK
jgi:hypothetical protein